MKELENVYVDEKMVLSIGFTPTKVDKEWPYTMIYSKDGMTLQYINPWGQGNMDEGWLLKIDGEEVPFKGYRNTAIGKLPNAFILFKEDLEKAIYKVSRDKTK